MIRKEFSKPFSRNPENLLREEAPGWSLKLESEKYLMYSTGEVEGKN